MKVVFIGEFGIGFTKGKIYDIDTIIQVNKEVYLLDDDNIKKRVVLSINFITLQEYRRNKIKKFLYDNQRTNK